MSELTDDQLDGLFRKSAEEFDPPFDPAAWQDMKTRLDTHDRTVTGGAPTWKNLLRWGIVGIVLLLLLGGVWFSYQNAVRSPVGSKLLLPDNEHQPEASTAASLKRTSASELGKTGPAQKTPSDLPTNQPGRNEQLNEANQPAIAVEGGVEPNTPDRRLDRAITRASETKLSATEKSPNAVLLTDKVAGEQKKKSEIGPSARSETAFPTTVRREKRTVLNRVGRKSGNRPSTRKQVETSLNRRETAFSSMSTDIANMSSSGKKQVQNRLESKRLADGNTFSTVASNAPVPEIDKAEFVSLPTLSELAIRPALWPAALAFRGRDVVAQPDTTARKSVPKSEPMRGFSVRLAVAPDLSAIGLKNFTRPGTNLGILLEYRLASRWSVQAGVIQSTKVYRALPTEYTASYGEWGGHVTPLSIDGRCNMLDIPINIRYDLIQHPQTDGRLMSRWFISGGITSYIINKEHYVYNYPTLSYAQNPGRDAATGGYGFSQLNLSAGYERAINKRLSWQIEPFIKAPLKGVGYFKTNLLSTGAFFSIRYKL